MTPLYARSVEEAHLFMDLRGFAEDRKQFLVEHPSGLVSVYSDEKGGRWEFSIPTPMASKGLYGDLAPSTLIGPGEWMDLADRHSKSCPASPNNLTPQQLSQACARMRIASEAIAELLKYFPPNADDLAPLPREHFKSSHDLGVLAREPGRFSKFRLQVVLETYRGILEKFRAAAQPTAQRAPAQSSTPAPTNAGPFGGAPPSPQSSMPWRSFDWNHRVALWITLQWAAVVAMDGKVTKQEFAALDAGLRRYNLPNLIETYSFEALLETAKSNAPIELMREMKTLDKERRVFLARLMVDFAKADGEVTPEELTSVFKIVETLGLSMADLKQ